jgi:membrane associated rhomboid family serine protease
MAKHFSLSRYNLERGRIYTFVTYAFSNMYFFSYLFDALTIYLFGRSIETKYGGNRLVKLFMLGTLLGGLAMVTFEPRTQFMSPQVGATTAVTAMLTFETCMNMGQKILFFVFPMRIEFLVAFLVFQSLFLDPLHRNLGGVLAGGVAFALFKRGMF